MTTLKRLCTFVILAPFVAAAVAAQHRPFMSAEHAGSKATVMILGDDVTVRVESKAGVSHASIGKGWTRVVNVRFSPDASRLAIVAETPAPQLSIVDATAARVIASYPIAAATVSPDGRAVIFEHAGKQTSDKSVIALLPLNDAGSGTAATIDVRGDTAGVRASSFTWTDPEVVVFLDRVGTELRAVALQVDASGRIQNRGQKAVPLKDAADVEISRMPSAGLTLRLQPAAAGAARIELRMW